MTWAAGEKHRAIPWIVLLVSLLFFLEGCTNSIFKGFVDVNKNEKAIPVQSWFQADSGYLLMNTKIDFMKARFSGLTVIKSVPDKGYRVIFLSAVGLKLWDMEFMPDVPVKVHYIMEAMNKRSVKKMLARDLGLILMIFHSGEKPVVLNEPSTGDRLLKYKEKSRRYYYRMPDGKYRPSYAIRTSGLSRNARADFYSHNGSGLDSVKIEHYHLNLRIHLIRIHENPTNAAE